MSLHLEVLVEEPSAETTLRELLPKVLPSDASFEIHAHQGKPALLRKLPSRLAAYAAMNWRDLRLLVLVDQDQEDCRKLKLKLERMAAEAGFATKCNAAGEFFQVVNRIAVEELEAWFFGDAQALRAAYPRIPASLTSRAPYRDPDAIRGGTSEALGRILHRAGYFGTERLQKLTVAAAIAPHLNPFTNRSRSFRCFLDGIKALTGESSNQSELETT